MISFILKNGILVVFSAIRLSLRVYGFLSCMERMSFSFIFVCEKRLKCIPANLE